MSSGGRWASSRLSLRDQLESESSSILILGSPAAGGLWCCDWEGVWDGTQGKGCPLPESGPVELRRMSHSVWAEGSLGWMGEMGDGMKNSWW